jgi:hypothetical protein
VLLADGHDTTQTASACGWANPSSFIAAFTNIIGTTPGRYRTSRRTTHARADAVRDRTGDDPRDADLGIREALAPDSARPAGIGSTPGRPVAGRSG